MLTKSICQPDSLLNLQDTIITRRPGSNFKSMQPLDMLNQRIINLSTKLAYARLSNVTL